MYCTHFRPKDSANKRGTLCWQAIADSHTPASGQNRQIVLYMFKAVKQTNVGAAEENNNTKKILKDHSFNMKKVSQQVIKPLF